MLRRLLFRHTAILLTLGMSIGLLFLFPSVANAAVQFQVPFRCGETWYARTYTFEGKPHQPSWYSIDWNLGGYDGGMPILASASGILTFRYMSKPGYGHYADIDHGNGWVTRYAHMEYPRSDLNGRYIEIGTVIGVVGSSGLDPGQEHLHYEQRLNGAVQPARFNGQAVNYTEAYPGNPYTSQNCPPPPVGSSDRAPFGPLDGVTKTNNGAYLWGWAIDPDTTGSIMVHIYVDGRHVATWPSNAFRPDVGAAFLGYGDWHGYGGEVPMGAGWHSVCAYAINYGFSAGNQQLGCKSVYVIPGDNPVGPFDGYTPLSGAIHGYGWMIDPNTAESGRVHVYADGRFVAEWQADASRPDVAAAFPGYGDRHGYGGLLFLSPGWHNVCIYGINLHAGGNELLGCRSVNVPPPAGYGHPYGRSFEFEDAYNRAGREGGIGTAINYAKWWGPGCNQDFAGGAYGRATIMQRGCWGPAYAVKGAHFHYLANRWGGNASSVLGYPYNDDHRWGPGWTQDFDGGQLRWSVLMHGDRVGHTYLVFGGIWAAYRSLGGADGRLGYPVSDEYPWYGEVHQGFEGGWIQWTPGGWRVVFK
jgi:hypothetical protein